MWRVEFERSYFVKRLTRLICAAASVILLLVVVNNSNNKTNKDIHIPPLLRQIPQYLWSHKSERTIILIRGKTSVGAAGGRRILIQTVGKNNNRRRQMFYRSHEPLMYQPSDPNNKQILLNSVHHHLRNQHSLLRLGRRPLQDIQAVQTVDLKDRPYGYQPETHLRRGGSANNNWFSTEPISPIQAIQTIELDFGTMTAGAPVQAIQTLRITGNPATVLPSSSAAERNYPPAEVQTGLQNLNPSSPMIGVPPTAIPFDRAQPDNRGDFELMAAGSWPSQISSTPQNPISRPATQTGDFILPRRPQQLGSVDFTTRAPSLWSPVIPESWWLRAGDEQPISLDSTTTNGPSVEISESTAELNTSTNNNIEPEGARRLEPNTAQESPTRSIMDLGQNTMTSWENLPTTTDYGGIERPAAWVGRSILPPINDGQTSTSREPRSQVIGRVENQSNRQQTAMPINMFIPRTGGGVQQLSYQRAPNQARPSGS